MRISDWSSDVCSSDLLVTGGGTKGRQFAHGWRERVYEFLGFSNNYDTFGMSEIVAGNSKCEVGNYHFPPVTVPYVLAVDSGRPLPRTGRQTGTLAVVDLSPENYEGGGLKDYLGIGREQ